MGIPYSKQINQAFDQVTPLVAAAYEVLQTTKNISLLLAAIQVMTCVFLGLILFALLGLIFTVNPELEKERKELVTPFMKWLASWVEEYGSIVSLSVKLFTVITTAGLGLMLYKGSAAGSTVPNEGRAEGADEIADAVGGASDENKE